MLLNIEINEAVVFSSKRAEVLLNSLI